MHPSDLRCVRRRIAASGSWPARSLVRSSGPHRFGHYDIYDTGTVRQGPISATASTDPGPLTIDSARLLPTVDRPRRIGPDRAYHRACNHRRSWNLPKTDRSCLVYVDTHSKRSFPGPRSGVSRRDPSQSIQSQRKQAAHDERRLELRRRCSSALI